MNKKGYNGWWTFMAFAIGILIGIGLLWFAIGQGWLGSFAPVSPLITPAA